MKDRSQHCGSIRLLALDGRVNAGEVIVFFVFADHLYARSNPGAPLGFPGLGGSEFLTSGLAYNH